MHEKCIYVCHSPAVRRGCRLSSSGVEPASGETWHYTDYLAEDLAVWLGAEPTGSET